METVTTQNNWLSLSEYSSEHGVSVSTLRRRIKNNQIKFRLINGKYFLDSRDYSPSKASTSSVPQQEASSLNSSEKTSENTFQTAKVLLDELKKAYMQSLQDKEKQIIHLKQQIADLKTLVMYLERENERINTSTRY